VRDRYCFDLHDSTAQMDGSAYRRDGARLVFSVRLNSMTIGHVLIREFVNAPVLELNLMLQLVRPPVQIGSGNNTEYGYIAYGHSIVRISKSFHRHVGHMH
jgi:hypothetical protein